MSPTVEVEATRNARSAPRRPRAWPRAWLAVLVPAMLLASEYKLRLRSSLAPVAGRPDLQVVVELGIYTLVALFLATQFGLPSRGRRPSGLLLLAGYFSAIMLASTLWAVYPSLALARGYQLAITAGLAWAIYTYGERDQLHMLCHAYVALVAASVCAGVLHPYPRNPGVANRFNWLYVHPVTAGTYLGLAIVILVAILWEGGPAQNLLRWPSWIYLALLVVDVGALLATRTRGALGGCVAGCVAILLWGRRRLSRRDLLAVFLIIGLLTAALFGNDILAFLLRDQGAARLESFGGRLPLWHEAINLVAQRPLLGYGLTAARGLFLGSFGLGGGHNAFINVVTDGGLIGSVCWLSLIVAVFVAVRQLWHSPVAQPDLTVLLGSMVFLVVNGVTTEGLSAAANLSSIWLYVVVGWLGVLRRASAEGAAPRRSSY